ncbi:MAG: UPF0254 family protein [Euryarchaeota archaeon]|nr:UPF0254 family protein [Euryarchaeota archaeon]
MIKIATAECFTHGIIAREIHASSQGYQGDFGPKLLKKLPQDVVLLCGMFIPTLSALKSVLNIYPPTPNQLIRGIKVYDEKTDQEVAVLMAKAVKNISGANIGIGTTAGIGRGGIAISTEKFTVKTTSDVQADLCSSNSEQLLKRQKSGVEKTLNILEEILGPDGEETFAYRDDVDVLKH